jgi:hypothetical protein
MLLVVLIITAVVVYVVSGLISNNKSVREQRLQLQRKEILDAILKNNKDRYVS